LWEFSILREFVFLVDRAEIAKIRTQKNLVPHGRSEQILAPLKQRNQRMPNNMICCWFGFHRCNLKHPIRLKPGQWVQKIG